MITPERRKEIQRKYTITHKQEILERSRLYYATNKDKIKERNWEYNHSEKRKSIRQTYKAKRRAWLKETDINNNWLTDLKERSKTCSICDCELTKENRHVDHILPLSVGGLHTMDNVRITCNKCNQGRPKNGRDEVKKAKLFLDYVRYNTIYIGESTTSI